MNNRNLSALTLTVALTGMIITGVTAYLLPHFPLVWKVSGAVSIVAALLYLYVDRGVWAETLSKRTTQYGLNSVLMAVLALGIVVMANIVIAKYDVKKDFTKNKLHTLSDQSVKIIKNLKSPVTIKAFVNPNQIQEFDSVFEKYTYHSTNVKKEFIDIDKDPFVLQKYKIKQPGTVIIESDARTARVENLWGTDDPKIEEKITNAIIQVAKGDKKKVYFLTGHGERHISDTGREGYSEAKEALEASRYKVEELLLIDKEKFPTDAEIVVVAGPKSEFMERELKLLEDYVRGGGKLLFMVEPSSPPALQAFLQKFGTQWKPKTTILETNPLTQMAGGNPLTPVVTTYASGQEITQDAREASLFAIATPVEKAANADKDLKVNSLFSTSSRSLEVDFLGDRVKVNQKTDRKGPLSLAVTVSGKVAAKTTEKKDEKAADAKDAEKEKKDQEFRMVVVGDADFAANGVRRFGMNSDLFQNMMSWLAKEEDLISIRPRPTDTSEFEITEERFRIIHLASVWIFPPMMFLSGIAVWFSRRRK